MSVTDLDIQPYCDKKRATFTDGGNLSSINRISYDKEKSISWVSKKQSSEFLYPIFIEWIITEDTCDYTTWLKDISEEHNVKQDVLTLYCKKLMTDDC